MTKRGVAILSYNRGKNLKRVVDSFISSVPADTKVIVCDDGSGPETLEVLNKLDCTVIRGKNLGVGANKNRALFALQDCNFVALVEDDLVVRAQDWFPMYEEVAMVCGIHHFCRVQGKQAGETIPRFSAYLKDHGIFPIYGLKPRGDFVFITRAVLDKVGAFHPNFVGAGYAHVNWQSRIVNAGLIPHPGRWIDLRAEEAGDPFEQLGDREGGPYDSFYTGLSRPAAVRLQTHRFDVHGHAVSPQLARAYRDAAVHAELPARCQIRQRFRIASLSPDPQFLRPRRNHA